MVRGGIYMRVGLLLPLLCAGCFGTKDADLEGMEVALVAAASIGHSASIVNAGMSGPMACVSITQGCTTYPCDGTAGITLGTECPLPLGGAGNGQVAVSGSWTASDKATLGMMYGIGVADGSVSVSQAVGVKVSGTNGHQTVTYAGQNVSVSSGATLAAQSSWTVDVDPRGSAGDPADDVYTIDGAQQGASTGATGQISLTGVLLDPACRKNPVAGMAVIQQVNGSSLVEQDLVTFHNACDGKVDVKGTLGGTHAQSLKLFH
jgi:hypothetical protein